MLTIEGAACFNLSIGKKSLSLQWTQKVTLLGLAGANVMDPHAAACVCPHAAAIPTGIIALMEVLPSRGPD